MTQQAIFNKSLKGLSKQNFRLSKSLKEGARCNYLSANGDRCAVGVLLTEEELKKVTGKSLNDDAVKDLVEALKIKRFSRHIDLLERLQSWHDCYLTHQGGISVYAFHRLEYLASYYLLKIPNYIHKLIIKENNE